MQVGFESTARSVPTATLVSRTHVEERIRNSSSLKPLGAFCITLYNESRDSFETTLRSLLQSLKAVVSEQDRMRWEICVVADGRDHVDPALLSALYQMELLSDDHASRRGAVESHRTVHDLEDLLAAFGVSGQPRAADRHEIALTVMVKDQNRGKLHSHYLFFNRFCRKIQPVYCFQIDVGTMLHPTCVAMLVQQMDSEPMLAALAPKVMPAVPSSDSSFIVEWQYFDFAYRKAVSWPFEVSTQFLSVIPGQVGIFRWSALDPVGVSAVDSPLRTYFRGMQAHDPLDRIMYLAEDRIIGASMVLSKEARWHLSYSPRAGATTDSCVSFRELLRQRRRWTNSSLACRWWLLTQLPSVATRKDRTLSAKAGLAVAALAQLALGLRELFAPAQVVGLIAVCIVAFSSPSSPLTQLLQYGFIGALLMQIAITVASAQRSSRLVKVHRWRHLIEWCSGALYVTVLCLKLPATALLILFAPAIALLPAALVLPHNAWPGLIRSQLFPFAGLGLFSILLCYALWNLHDVSWGTKGLTATTHTPTASKRMHALRNRAFCSFLLLNAGAIALVTRAGWLSAHLNLVTELSCMLEFAMALAAFGFLLFRSLRRNDAQLYKLGFSSVPLSVVERRVRIQRSCAEPLVGYNREQRGVTDHAHLS